MQSEKPSLDVGKLLTGLLGPGKPLPRRYLPAPSVSTTPAAAGGHDRQPAAHPDGDQGARAVRAGGIVVGHITRGDYARLQQHLANGGRVDITIICS